MSSKIITKLESLTPTQKVIIITAIITLILSCSIVTFFIFTNSDVDSVSSSTGTFTPETSLEISGNSSSSSDSPDNSVNSSNNSSNTKPSGIDNTPQLMDTPIETPSSNDQSSATQKPSQNTTTQPTTTPTPAPAPIKTPEELDPICGGKYAVSTRCIIQKMYGTQYPGKTHPFAYDVANQYSQHLQNGTQISTRSFSLSGDSDGALAMISKDLRQNETDKVNVHFYAYKSGTDWNVDWKVYVFKKTGDKSYAAYIQTARYWVSSDEQKAITDRYIPEYTKEFRETITLYENNYLTWYNNLTK